MIICINNVIPGTNLLVKLDMHLIHSMTCEIQICLLRWVAAFLQGRSQFVHIASSTSTSQCLNGGIPQGTKLGLILFAVMVNDLLPTWGPRAKFVDDLTALEIIPRNSPSLMSYIVSDIQRFTVNNNIKLNPSKCLLTFFITIVVCGGPLLSVAHMSGLQLNHSNYLGCTYRMI